MTLNAVSRDWRIECHPILSIPDREAFAFVWHGQQLQAHAGETIASALFANGIRVFGHHPKDGSPQGIFCANGQCAQCTVTADGLPVKACMTQIRPGMIVQSAQPLVEVMDASRFRCKVRVGSDSAQHVETGRKVTVRCDALPSRTFEGRVSGVHPMPQSGGPAETVIIVNLDDPGGSLKAGMTATVEFER